MGRVLQRSIEALGEADTQRGKPHFLHNKTRTALRINNRWYNPSFFKETSIEIHLFDSKGKIKMDENENDDDVFGDEITLSMKSCKNEKKIQKTRKIHMYVPQKNLSKKDMYIATSLITTYAKCGALEQAREIFDQLPIRNVMAWNALIIGYAKNRLGDEALKCFRHMQDEGVWPDAVTYASILKACGIVGSLEIGEYIGIEVRKKGLLEKDVVLGNALLDMYCKCGVVEKAQEVFEMLPERNVVSWSALIAGYAQNGLANDALKCFRKMKDIGICPNSVTYICTLKACAILGSLELGEDIYADVRKQGLLQKNIVLGTALVDMYSKCGAMSKAQEVFHQLPEPNVVSWNALIAGYAQNGLAGEALKCFRQMKYMRIYPNEITYICILKACGILRSLEVGTAIDAEVRKQGLLQEGNMLGIALVDMYSKCGALSKAQEVFDQIPEQNVVSWNALIAGYAHNGFGDEALECFRQMQNGGTCSDEVTYVCVLKACGIVRSLEIGKDIEAEVRKKGLLKKVIIGNALVDMYSKCGAIEKAREVFEQLPEKNVVSWNALITGYVQIGFGAEALECFTQMQNEGASPDVVTYVCILKACGVLGCLEIGKDIDTKVREQGLLQDSVVLGNALVDMYSKCGLLEKAQEAFEQLQVRDIVSWNALISGSAQLGRVDMVLDLYNRMRVEDVPNLVTFIVLLNACSHAGLLEEGEKLFDEMCCVYCLNPTLEHYTCMIDLFGRAGHFDKVKALLDRAQHFAHLPLFQSIMGYCRRWGNVKLGRWAFEESVQLDEKCAATYVCMGNIHAAVGMQT